MNYLKNWIEKGDCFRNDRMLFSQQAGELCGYSRQELRAVTTQGVFIEDVHVGAFVKYEEENMIP